MGLKILSEIRSTVEAPSSLKQNRVRVEDALKLMFRLTKAYQTVNEIARGKAERQKVKQQGPKKVQNSSMTELQRLVIDD